MNLFDELERAELADLVADVQADLNAENVAEAERHTKSMNRAAGKALRLLGAINEPEALSAEAAELHRRGVSLAVLTLVLTTPAVGTIIRREVAQIGRPLTPEEMHFLVLGLFQIT